MSPSPNRGGRPRGSLNPRGHTDEARLDIHDAADGLRHLDAQLAQARLAIREVWTSLASAARHLDTADHLPACEQAATLAVA